MKARLDGVVRWSRLVLLVLVETPPETESVLYVWGAVETGGAWWRCAGADLSDATLHGAVLTHAPVIGATLTDADLRVARLRVAKLRDANRTGVTLTLAYRSGADLM